MHRKDLEMHFAYEQREKNLDGKYRLASSDPHIDLVRDILLILHRLYCVSSGMQLIALQYRRISLSTELQAIPGGVRSLGTFKYVCKLIF